MKKSLKYIFSLFIVFLMSGATASAMSVSDPSGTNAGGWYKDSFSVTIQHGGLACTGIGSLNTYVYTSTNSGQHTYDFYNGTKDDPFLRIDGGNFKDLDNVCSSSPTNTIFKTISAKIDSQGPFVNISTPASSASTANSTYTVSGTASDSEGNLKTIQAKVNGTLGPTASISSNTFSVSVSLNNGSNTVQMIATDVVGHTTASNTVTITRGSSSGGGGGGSTSTGGSGSTTSSGASSSSSSGNSSSTGSVNKSGAASATGGNNTTSGSQSQDSQTDSPQLIRLDLDTSNKPSNPEDVQQKAAVAGATGLSFIALLAIIAILLGLCIYIFVRYRPDKPGLRRRIILIVTLPSLVPLLGLGFLGYQQLSDSVKNQLSDQLQKAAEASAVKLDREFSIRGSVISNTASHILQMKSQYQAQQLLLDQQKASASAKSSLTEQENIRVNEELTSVRILFKDVLEIVVVDSSKDAAVKATLARKDVNSPTIAATHKDLLAQAATSELALYETRGNLHQILLTIPIKNKDASIGGVVVALDTQQEDFIPSIWRATPKSYNADPVYILSADGQLVTPGSNDKQLITQLKPLAKATQASVTSLTTSGDTYTVRTAQVKNVKWVVAVGTPASSVLAPIAGLQRTAILAIAGFVLLSVFLGAWFANKIAVEVRQLYDGALKFAKGNLNHRIELDSKDELQVLGDTLNQMATDIKNAQTALIEKDKEFIHVASHELKAPMTIIIGYMSMIVENGMEKFDKETQDMFREVYGGTVRLRDLIIDLLDIARLESGKAEFKLERIDIGAVADTIISSQKLPAQQADITLVHKTDALSPKAFADSSKLQIVMTNFITNAIKYNRKGGTVTVAHEIKDGQLVTSVADTGLGIPLDQQSHIFEKFYRVKDEDRAKVPGTGLGMYITKQFVENMGGKVWFESEHGKGTTFYFSLPLEQKTVIGSDNSVDLDQTQEK